MSFLAPIAGAVVGGLMGGSDKGSSQTQSKDPWGPAQVPLTNSLATGQDLERYYQQNQFNPIQQQGYQNQFSDLDQYRNQIAPQLMNFANGMMTSNYQRGPRNSQMEAMQGQQRQGMGQPQMMQQGQDGTYQPAQGGGLSAAMGQAGQGMSAPNSSQSMMDYLRSGMTAQGGQQGLLSGIGQGAFQAPTAGSYGLLNFPELNPFTSTTGIPKKPVKDPNEKTPEQIWREEANQRERDRQTNIGGA